MSLIQIGDAVRWAGRVWRRYIHDNTRIDEVGLELSPEGNRVGDKLTVKLWQNEDGSWEGTDIIIEWDGECWRRLS